MADSTRILDTIDGLAARLVPVRRLLPPPTLAAIWLGALLALAALLYAVLDGQIGWMSRAYVLPAFIAALATTVLAVVAAFELSRPDRSDSWALLPLPALLLWAGLSGLGCLANLGDGLSWGATWAETRECLLVILGSAIPLSALLFIMLRRARPERATRVALVAGLASAAAAGSILILVHPHNSTVLDLAVHGVCVAAVIGINALLGGRLFERASRARPR